MTTGKVWHRPGETYKKILFSASRNPCRRLAEQVLEAVDLEDERYHCFADRSATQLLNQADHLDAIGPSDQRPLYGMPVGVKDIISVAGLETTFGVGGALTERPDNDAAVVRRLREAGALIVGKTVATELAFLHPASTLNPQGVDYTPGGSSAGSASAVAAGCIAMGVGTQTGGSITRPASFCGTFAIKPTFGLISRDGVLSQSPTLDTVGFLGTDLSVLEVVLSALTPLAAPVDRSTLRVARLQGDLIDRAPDYVLTHLKEIGREHCGFIKSVKLSDTFSRGIELRQQINAYELSHQFSGIIDRHGSLLSQTLLNEARCGSEISTSDYFKAIREIQALSKPIDCLFEDFDCLLLPSAPGEAPKGLTSTGDSIFNASWTLLGYPSVTMPMVQGPSGMPWGLQLVGPKYSDRQLLRDAALFGALL